MRWKEHVSIMPLKRSKNAERLTGSEDSSLREGDHLQEGGKHSNALRVGLRGALA